MVTRTGGRLPWPRLVITSGGTSMPVAVLPLSWMIARNFITTSLIVFATARALAFFSTRRYSTHWSTEPSSTILRDGRLRRSGMVHAAPAGTLGTGEQPPGGRSARKRQAIIEAATTLFLEQGYQGTSMDDIAAMAAVSKQTVYKNFADKQQLFSDIVLGAAARADEFIAALPRMLADTDDLEAALKALARRYLATVMQPRLLQMRRLIVAESGRFPDLARAYYERVPEHVMTGLAAQFGDLA